MLNRFYCKNELWFAISAIIVYVIVMGNLQANCGTGSIYSVIGLLAIAAVLLAFVLKNRLTRKYGLAKPAKAKSSLYFIPLVLIASVNLWCGIKLHYDVCPQLLALCSMALSGLVEELIFRGLLFRAIEKSSRKEAVIISSVTFGMGHIINLLTGAFALETFLQMAYAIAIGFAFVMVFLRSGSLLPCILAHSFINMTAELSVSNSGILMYIQVVFLIVVAGGYAVYLARSSSFTDQ